MIDVTIEIRENTLTRRMRVVAPSLERALDLAGLQKPGSRVRLLSPIDHKTLPAGGEDLFLEEVA